MGYAMSYAKGSVTIPQPIVIRVKNKEKMETVENYGTLGITLPKRPFNLTTWNCALIPTEDNMFKPLSTALTTNLTIYVIYSLRI